MQGFIKSYKQQTFNGTKLFEMRRLISFRLRLVVLELAGSSEFLFDVQYFPPIQYFQGFYRKKNSQALGKCKHSVPLRFAPFAKWQVFLDAEAVHSVYARLRIKGYDALMLRRLGSLVAKLLTTRSDALRVEGDDFHPRP